MSFFDKFKSKSNVPEGYAEVNVTFTQEENEAIATSLQQYAAIANADAPEGSTMYVHPKVKVGMKAKALAEYVEDLMARLPYCESDQETASLMQKAIHAQAAAYAVHNLPVYLFQLAGMFEFSGDAAKAKDFFRNFLRANAEFRPDQVDTIFLAQSGFDLQEIVEVAKGKIR